MRSLHMPSCPCVLPNTFLRMPSCVPHSPTKYQLLAAVSSFMLLPFFASLHVAPGLAAQVPLLEGTPRWRFGDQLGAGEPSVGDVTDLAIGRAGKVYVLDGMASQLTVLASDGSVDRIFDGTRKGPGEMLIPCCLRLSEDERSIWILNLGARAHRRYDLATGNYVKEVEAAGMAQIPLMRRPHGFAVAVRRPRQAHLLVDTVGVPVDTIVLPAVEELGTAVWKFLELPNQHGRTMRLPIRAPYSPFPFLIHGPTGTVAVGHTSGYRVEILGPSGRRRAVIARDVGPVPLRGRERKEAELRLDSLAEHYRLQGGQYPTFELPDRKPPIQDVWFDADGRLWVQLAVREPAEFSTADVYDDSGKPLFRARWPKKIVLNRGAIRGQDAVGVEVGPYDVQIVTFLRFAPIAAQP